MMNFNRVWVLISNGKYGEIIEYGDEMLDVAESIRGSDRLSDEEANRLAHHLENRALYLQSICDKLEVLFDGEDEFYRDLGRALTGDVSYDVPLETLDEMQSGEE